jgi:hypothetical protein
MLMVSYVYTRESNQNPNSKSLELHQTQHYCPVSHVIAQQYLSHNAFFPARNIWHSLQKYIIIFFIILQNSISGGVFVMVTEVYQYRCGCVGQTQLWGGEYLAGQTHMNCLIIEGSKKESLASC